MRMSDLCGEKTYLRQTLSGDLIPGSGFSGGHNLDLLQLCSLHSKKLGHLDNLPWIYKIIRVGTKLRHPWAEFSATHALGNFQLEITFPILLVLPTEFANYHNSLPPKI